MWRSAVVQQVCTGLPTGAYRLSYCPYGFPEAKPLALVGTTDVPTCSNTTFVSRAESAAMYLPNACREPVIEQARELWRAEQQHLLSRVRFEAGSFFDSVPAGDVYLLRQGTVGPSAHVKQAPVAAGLQNASESPLGSIPHPLLHRSNSAVLQYCLPFLASAAMLMLPQLPRP